MKLSYTFKNAEASEELVATTEEKLEKLAKLEMKPAESAEAIFRAASKGQFEVELKLHGGNGPVEAHGTAENFLSAVEIALERLEKQLWRRKDRVQHHKNPESRKQKGE